MVSQHSNSCCCPVIVGCHKRRGQDHFDAQNDGHATYEPTLCRAGIPPRDEKRQDIASTPLAGFAQSPCDVTG